MDKMKQWVALTVVGCLAVLAAGWFLLVSPKRADASDLRNQASGVEASNQGLQTKLAMLKAQAKQLPQYQAKLAQVAAKIPNNPALPSLIRALSAAADDAGVELLSVAPTPPVAYQGSASAPQHAPVSAAPSASSSSGGATLATAGAAPAPTLESIGLALSVAGGYFETERFFDSLESLTRALKVNGLTMAAGTNPMKQANANTPSASQPNGDVLLTSINATVFMSPSTTLAAAPVKPTVTPVK